MFVDTVVEDKALHKPAFLIGLSVTVLAIFFAFNFTNTIFGEFLSPVIGNPEESGLFGRFVVSFVLSVIFVLNLLAISFARLKIQILIVWFELFLLFLAFAYSFDLKLSFIQSRIGLMISKGLFTTIYISAVSIVIATAIAIVGAIAKLSNNGFAYAIASFYTSLFRGLPLLLQVYLIYKGLPQLGFMVDAIPSGIAALSLCYGAYMTEIFRAGIQSIARGQTEAAQTIGLNYFQTMRYVILPQALRRILPPLANQFIYIVKMSAFASVIGMQELTRRANEIVVTEYRPLEIYTLLIFEYLILVLIISFGVRWLERKLGSNESAGG